MKLNIGSGWKPQAGYVNVDLYATDGVDVRCDLREMKFGPESCDEVMAIHVLEHFTREDCEKICRDVYGFLKPGRQFVIEMPERARCCELIRMGLGKPDKDGLPSVKRRVMNGTKGLLGGRMGDKEAWARWLIENAEAILARAEQNEPTVDLIPDEYNSPGYPHLYVWEQEEFAKMLQEVGFTTSLEKPLFHGMRYGRDMRCVGTKE